MHAQLAQIVKKALEINPESFGSIVKEAAQLICSEEGQLENLNVLGRLVKIKPLGKALLIGDLHGDLESLVDILKQSNFVQELGRDNNNIVMFLGDYGDRGMFSAETYYVVLKLKLLFPNQIILLRGNHEGPEDLLAHPHDLPLQLQWKFGEEGKDVYLKIRELFACLYNAVLVENRYLIIHGGLPIGAQTLEDLANAHLTHPRKSFLEDMLWSDPNGDSEDYVASPRGAGKLFSKKATTEMLDKFNVHLLIRGHEPCEEGFKIDHEGKILTLFSRKGTPYFNTRGAYLILDLSKEFKNASELIPFIHKF